MTSVVARYNGVEAARADHLATLVVAAEGAVAMCRAQRGTEALDRVVAELTALVGAAVER